MSFPPGFPSRQFDPIEAWHFIIEIRCAIMFISWAWKRRRIIVSVYGGTKKYIGSLLLYFSFKLLAYGLKKATERQRQRNGEWAATFEKLFNDPSYT